MSWLKLPVFVNRKMYSFIQHISVGRLMCPGTLLGSVLLWTFLRETPKEILRNEKKPTGGNDSNVEKVTRESVFHV